MPVKFVAIYLIRPLLKTGLGLLCLFVLATVSTNAATIVGESKKIQNVVMGSQGERRLKVADDVHASEKISAAVESHGELLLNDGSKIIVGENSIVSLDDFAVSEGGIKKGTVRLTKGALRFITGNSKKGTFTIKTPVSTIGLRGTAVDTYHRNGVTRLVLLDGEARGCGDTSCIIAKRSCDIIEIKSDGNAVLLPFLRNKDANRQEEDTSFILLADQRRFASGWRLGTRICDIRRTNAFLQELDEGRAERSSDGGSESERDRGGKYDN